MHTCDVLILSASYGAGHNQVSAALKTALTGRRPELRVEIRDFMDITLPRANRITQVGYVQMVRRFPAGYRWFYESTSSIHPGSGAQMILNRLGRDRFLGFIRRTSPGLIVCTFPIPAGMLSSLRLQGVHLPPWVTVVTDVVVHSQWLNPGTEAYVVPDESLVAALAARGIPAHRIHPFGIPLRPGFAGLPGWRGDSQAGDDAPPEQPRFTALVMGGALGVLDAAPSICDALLDLGSDIKVIAVAGRNQILRRRLAHLSERSRGALEVHGYVENVPDLMRSSHVLISKAGGVTVYEALAMGLPMLIFRPIPGQEEGNTRFLSRTGAGQAFTRISDLVHAVRGLMVNPARRQSMRAAALAYGRPHAAERTAELLLSLVKDGGARSTRPAAASSSYAALDAPGEARWNQSL
ncbi:MAG: glycosyltransferase [Firmicutes bacterium]|nr:glycosyltransferase [Bacillota bacterium]